MNTMHLAGNLGADPEVRFTPNGNKVTTLRLAAKARRSGSDETIWWRVTVWGDQFDKLIAHLKKGSSVMVIGDMHKPEIYTAKDGTPQVSLNMTAYNISFSPFGRSDRNPDEAQGGQVSSGGSAQAQPQPAMSSPVQGSAPESSHPEDDLPF